jgi:hypothetical protein
VKSSFDLQTLHNMNFVPVPISSGVFVQFSHRMIGLSRTLDTALLSESAKELSAVMKSVTGFIAGLGSERSWKTDMAA